MVVMPSSRARWALAAARRSSTSVGSRRVSSGAERRPLPVMWTWVSMKPGARTRSPRSSVCSPPLTLRSIPTWTMRPSSTRISRASAASSATTVLARIKTRGTSPLPAGEEDAVVHEPLAGLRFEAADQIPHPEPRFFLAADIQDHLALMHHHQPVPVAQRVLHVVRHHQRGQLVIANHPVRDLEDARTGLRV